MFTNEINFHSSKLFYLKTMGVQKNLEEKSKSVVKTLYFFFLEMFFDSEPTQKI
jgi:hypothetical protein